MSQKKGPLKKLITQWRCWPIFLRLYMKLHYIILLKPWKLQYQTIISFDDISFLVKDKENQILPDLWRYFRQFYHKRENKKCSTLIRLWCLIVLIKWEWTKKTACKNLFSFSFSKPLKFYWWCHWSQKKVFPI